MGLKIVNLLSASGVAATQTGSSKSLAKGGTKPISGETDGYCRNLTVALDLTISAGSGTLTPSVEGKFGSTWMELTPTSAWTAATASGEQVRTFTGPVPLEIKGIATRAGTITFDCTMTAIGID